MSRTDLDATTLASSLRMRAGDGSMEWVYEPIQASVLLDIADLADENAKLRKYAKLMHDHINECCNACGERCICDIDALTRELGIEVD